MIKTANCWWVDLATTTWPQLRALGFGGDRTLEGGPGADQLVSEGSYNDDLRGGPGPDVLTSMSGGESRDFDGGSGPDEVTIAGQGDIVVRLAGDGDRLRASGEIYLVLFVGGRGPVDGDLTAGTVRLIGADTGDVITHLTSASPYIVVYAHSDGDRISGNYDQVDGGVGNDTAGPP